MKKAKLAATKKLGFAEKTSIIAKTTRDARVSTLCTEHPDVAARYAWASNKGYPAPQHLGGIRTHGVTEWHRRSFGPCKPNARVDGS